MMTSSAIHLRLAAAACVATLLAIALPEPVQAGTIVRFDTNMGSFDVELYDSVVPTTVSNFLSYVNDGSYENTLVHRSVADFVIQGGGFSADDASDIASHGNIPLEYSIPNSRGTLAMARTPDPNSASSQWFINTSDNSSILAPNPSSDGYAVFGYVLGNGMDVVDAINALQTFAFSSPFGEIPLMDYGQQDFNSGVPALPHAVVVNGISVVPEPSTVVLFSLGALGMAVSGWRKRRLAAH